jgi:hypothetical protein
MSVDRVKYSSTLPAAEKLRLVMCWAGERPGLYLVPVPINGPALRVLDHHMARPQKALQAGLISVVRIEQRSQKHELLHLALAPAPLPKGLV